MIELTHESIEIAIEAALKAAHLRSTPESRKDMRRAIEAAINVIGDQDLQTMEERKAVVKKFTMLTPEEIDALNDSMCGEREFYQDFALSIMQSIINKNTI